MPGGAIMKMHSICEDVQQKSHQGDLERDREKFYKTAEKRLSCKQVIFYCRKKTCKKIPVEDSFSTSCTYWSTWEARPSRAPERQNGRTQPYWRNGRAIRLQWPFHYYYWFCSNFHNLHFVAKDPIMLKATQSQNQDCPCSQMFTTYAKR